MSTEQFQHWEQEMDMLSHPKKLSTVDSHWRGEVLLARKHASSSHDHISILSLVILSTKVCFICLFLFKLMICLIYLFMMLLGINSRALYVAYPWVTPATLCLVFTGTGTLHVIFELIL